MAHMEFVSGGVCLWWWSLGCLPIQQLRATLSGVRGNVSYESFNLDISWHTVDGSEIPNNHLGDINLVKNGVNYISTGDRRISEPSTVASSYTFQGVKEFAGFHRDAARSVYGALVSFSGEDLLGNSTVEWCLRWLSLIRNYLPYRRLWEIYWMT